jgi:hypothetical protein
MMKSEQSTQHHAQWKTQAGKEKKIFHQGFDPWKERDKSHHCPVNKKMHQKIDRESHNHKNQE